MNEFIITAMFVTLGICAISYIWYTIYKDMKSKEQMFEIQITAAKSKSIRDTIPPSEMYKIVDDMIRFYVSKTVTISDFEGKSDGELSLLLDNIIISISTEVEIHLSDTFKRNWEVYFDPVEGSVDVISHLKMYIAYNVRINLIQIIEKLKQRQRRSVSRSNQAERKEPEDKQTIEQKK